ncbi:hypothetical protein [Actinosynnema pretiosum]|uniref:hypothetical protein n=1 Tax=Actinosynnema pretiosum TaxID=42197 RepID=UPI0015A6EDB8|nr:hypothetical protein [Actinosynnema pretiosum]
MTMQEDHDLPGVAPAGDDVSTATAPIFEENALQRRGGVPAGFTHLVGGQHDTPECCRQFTRRPDDTGQQWSPLNPADHHRLAHAVAERPAGAR